MSGVPQAEAVEMLLCALYEGSACHPPWVRDWGVADELEELAYERALEMLIPYQYLLITLATDAARAATRRAVLGVRAAAEKVLELLDRYERAQRGSHPEWAKLVALLDAPFPIRRPETPDTRDADVIAVIVRDAWFGGSWTEMLESLSLQTWRALWRIDSARIRRLAAFEEAYSINVAHLFLGPDVQDVGAYVREDIPRPTNHQQRGRDTPARKE